MTVDPRLEAVQNELRRYPLSVSEEFQKAGREMAALLLPSQLQEWGDEGVRIAHQTVRSWEAASEYFRVSPNVYAGIGYAQLIEWARWGAILSQDSPTMAVAFFRASQDGLLLMGTEHVPAWARLGQGLYKGTWKSTTLAARFFEATPTLLKFLTFKELARFSQVIESLSHRSSDLAVECLALGRDTFPKMQGEWDPFISLLTTLANGNWREVKGSFEAGLRALNKVEAGQRQRLLSLAQGVARHGGSNIPGFLQEAGNAFGQLDRTSHPTILNMGEALVQPAPSTVVEFIKSCPPILGRITEEQLGVWFGEGLRYLKENGDGGTAYFRVESARSEEVLDHLSSGVELARVQDVLRMYCRALAGETVDIAVTQELVNKGIGWVSKERATTESTTVYLPPVVDRFHSKEDNFTWYKVVATHQVAHLEFASFDFDYERPANLFQDWRFTLSPNGANGHETVSTDGQGVERMWLTDMSRFFDLFDDRKLILDVFTVLEDARVDYLVKNGYAGIRPAYQRIQRDAIKDRPQMAELPAKEAIVEYLVRLSLGADEAQRVPAEYTGAAATVGRVLRQLLDPQASVEDVAEAALRVYEVLHQIPNEDADEWEDTDAMDEPASEQEMLDINQPGIPGETPGPESMESQKEEREYRSPQDVEYRGDFKPELTQLLSRLRDSQEQAGAQSGGEANEISQEELESLLERSQEVELKAVQGQIRAGAEMYANNLLREVGRAQPQAPEFRQHMFMHSDEEEGPLEATEPDTFLYNEWDFRAGDYKPRWCMIREKALPEGDTAFYQTTLENYTGLINRVRRQFELVLPEAFRKIKRLPDGEEFDLDAVIEAVIDRKSGNSPSDKLYWRRNKVVRDVAVVFLLDMSASTAEAIDDGRKRTEDWDAPDDPVEYMLWLRQRRAQGLKRPYKRIIDVEKESTVLLIHALETIGDVYGIYGFSGYGRENVEFYVVKDIDAPFTERVSRRIDKISPLHATRMGPAIRHASQKLSKQDARTKILFLISDGRPQDRGYSREGVEKEYAVHDTKAAFNEARRMDITPFCLTVDKAGHDYLKTMAGDMAYEVLDDISQLPERLPYLYRKLTV